MWQTQATWLGPGSLSPIASRAPRAPQEAGGGAPSPSLSLQMPFKLARKSPCLSRLLSTPTQTSFQEAHWPLCACGTQVQGCLDPHATWALCKDLCVLESVVSDTHVFGVRAESASSLPPPWRGYRAGCPAHAATLWWDTGRTGGWSADRRQEGGQDRPAPGLAFHQAAPTLQYPEWSSPALQKTA